uniref:WNK lysine deficient protein kinase 1b n=1 Tax=Nothobranchius kadleci TaxID=1051664 RepID=A0A1A8CWZ1_NOTKA
MSESSSKAVKFIAPAPPASYNSPCPSPQTSHKNVNGSASSDTHVVEKLDEQPVVRRRRHTMDRDSKTAEHRFFRRSVICDSNATALDLPSKAAVILTSPPDCGGTPAFLSPHRYGPEEYDSDGEEGRRGPCLQSTSLPPYLSLGGTFASGHIQSAGVDLEASVITIVVPTIRKADNSADKTKEPIPTALDVADNTIHSKPDVTLHPRGIQDSQQAPKDGKVIEPVIEESISSPTEEKDRETEEGKGVAKARAEQREVDKRLQEDTEEAETLLPAPFPTPDPLSPTSRFCVAATPRVFPAATAADAAFSATPLQWRSKLSFAAAAQRLGAGEPLHLPGQSDPSLYGYKDMRAEHEEAVRRLSLNQAALLDHYEAMAYGGYPMTAHQLGQLSFHHQRQAAAAAAGLGFDSGPPPQPGFLHPHILQRMSAHSPIPPPFTPMTAATGGSVSSSSEGCYPPQHASSSSFPISAPPVIADAPPPTGSAFEFHLAAAAAAAAGDPSLLASRLYRARRSSMDLPLEDSSGTGSGGSGSYSRLQPVTEELYAYVSPELPLPPGNLLLHHAVGTLKDKSPEPSSDSLASSDAGEFQSPPPPPLPPPFDSSAAQSIPRSSSTSHYDSSGGVFHGDPQGHPLSVQHFFPPTPSSELPLGSATSSQLESLMRSAWPRHGGVIPAQPDMTYHESLLAMQAANPPLQPVQVPTPQPGPRPPLVPVTTQSDLPGTSQQVVSSSQSGTSVQSPTHTPLPQATAQPSLTPTTSTIPLVTLPSPLPVSMAVPKAVVASPPSTLPVPVGVVPSVVSSPLPPLVPTPVPQPLATVVPVINVVSAPPDTPMEALPKSASQSAELSQGQLQPPQVLSSIESGHSETSGLSDGNEGGGGRHEGRSTKRHQRRSVRSRSRHEKTSKAKLHVLSISNRGDRVAECQLETHNRKMVTFRFDLDGDNPEEIAQIMVESEFILESERESFIEQVREVIKNADEKGLERDANSQMVGSSEQHIPVMSTPMPDIPPSATAQVVHSAGRRFIVSPVPEDRLKEQTIPPSLSLASHVEAVRPAQPQTSDQVLGLSQSAGTITLQQAFSELRQNKNQFDAGPSTAPASIHSTLPPFHPAAAAAVPSLSSTVTPTVDAADGILNLSQTKEQILETSPPPFPISSAPSSVPPVCLTPPFSSSPPPTLIHQTTPQSQALSQPMMQAVSQPPAQIQPQAYTQSQTLPAVTATSVPSTLPTANIVSIPPTALTSPPPSQPPPIVSSPPSSILSAGEVSPDHPSASPTSSLTFSLSPPPVIPTTAIPGPQFTPSTPSQTTPLPCPPTFVGLQPVTSNVPLVQPTSVHSQPQTAALPGQTHQTHCVDCDTRSDASESIIKPDDIQALDKKLRSLFMDLGVGVPSTQGDIPAADLVSGAPVTGPTSPIGTCSASITAATTPGPQPPSSLTLGVLGRRYPPLHNPLSRPRLWFKRLHQKLPYPGHHPSSLWRTWMPS